MHSSAKAVAAPRSIEWGLLRVVFFTIFIIVVLAWSTAAADARCNGTVNESKDALSADSDAAATKEILGTVEADTETVTMSIPLEEGAVIDVEAPPMGVKIEKWDGDDVLLIVERTKRARPGDVKPTPVVPVNIQVTRRGKDVRIETTGGAGWKNNGMDLSFRILLPDRTQIETRCGDPEDVAARLTGAVWRAFHNEAFKWLVR